MTTASVQPGVLLIEMESPAERIRSRRRERLRRIDASLEIGLLALLIGAVLAFGAVQTWAIVGMRVGATVLFALWTIRQLICAQLEILRSESGSARS